MGWFAKVLWFLGGGAAGYFSYIFLCQILIITRCAFPLLKKLSKHRDLMDVSRCKRFYRNSMFFAIFVFSSVLFAVVRWCPESCFIGYGGTLFFLFTIGLGNYGINLNNLSDFSSTAKEYVYSGKEQEFDAALLFVVKSL